MCESVDLNRAELGLVLSLQNKSKHYSAENRSAHMERVRCSTKRTEGDIAVLLRE
ncbi:unnamed protein product, partial [Pleuronectes platessa]